jgi:hypothetical protein
MRLYLNRWESKCVQHRCIANVFARCCATFVCSKLSCGVVLASLRSNFYWIGLMEVCDSDSSSMTPSRLAGPR